jgi:hypothetical protein
MNIAYGVICTCHSCKSPLGIGYRVNIFNGGPYYCGRCGANVTIDVYGKGHDGYYIVSNTGVPVFYRYKREAYEIAKMFKAKLYYAYKF